MTKWTVLIAIAFLAAAGIAISSVAASGGRGDPDPTTSVVLGSSAATQSQPRTQSPDSVNGAHNGPPTNALPGPVGDDQDGQATTTLVPGRPTVAGPVAGSTTTAAAQTSTTSVARPPASAPGPTRL